jgi:hypothetical protein
MAICLPGIASRVNRALTSEMRPGALGDHDEIDDGQDREHDDADRVVAADHELAEGLDHVARRGRALVTVQQHHARGGDIERQAQQGCQQQHGGENAEVQRA